METESIIGFHMYKRLNLLMILILGLILINGCINDNIYKQPKSKEGAEATADKFAREWEQKDFLKLYDLFVPALQNKKNKAEFVEFMDYIESCLQLLRHFNNYLSYEFWRDSWISFC